jgi:exopolyphosphatase/guanosine-5'-triphosphate,3'-diphosphate pyrophosphatase
LTRLAAIDVGTNTIRMLVADRSGKGFRPVARRRTIVGMGRTLRDTGRIGDEEFRDSLAVLRAFRREMERLGVDRYRACGTACLREASNGDAFRAAASAAGVTVEAIGPDEEALLAWKGIRTRVAGRPGDVTMDIGGGSTEFASGPGKGESVSIPTGVVVLSSLIPLSDPPQPWEVRAVSYYAARRVEDGTRIFGHRKFRRLIGTAGTFTTLAALEKRVSRYDPGRIDGTTLSAAVLRRWSDRLCGMTDARRLALPGMEKGRERYIVPGVLLALAAISRFGVKRVTVSDAGLLEGILAAIAENRGGGA